MQFEAFGLKDRKSVPAFCTKETITSPVGCSGVKSPVFIFPLPFFPDSL